MVQYGPQKVAWGATLPGYVGPMVEPTLWVHMWISCPRIALNREMVNLDHRHSRSDDREILRVMWPNMVSGSNMHVGSHALDLHQI